MHITPQSATSNQQKKTTTIAPLATTEKRIALQNLKGSNRLRMTSKAP